MLAHYRWDPRPREASDLPRVWPRLTKTLGLHVVSTQAGSWTGWGRVGRGRALWPEHCGPSLGPGGEAQGEVSLRGVCCPGLGVEWNEKLFGSQALAEAEVESGTHLDRPAGRQGDHGSEGLPGA